LELKTKNLTEYHRYLTLGCGHLIVSNPNPVSPCFVDRYYCIRTTCLNPVPAAIFKIWYFGALSENILNNPQRQFLVVSVIWNQSHKIDKAWNPV